MGDPPPDRGHGSDWTDAKKEEPTELDLFQQWQKEKKKKKKDKLSKEREIAQQQERADLSRNRDAEALADVRRDPELVSLYEKSFEQLKYLEELDQMLPPLETPTSRRRYNRRHHSAPADSRSKMPSMGHVRGYSKDRVRKLAPWFNKTEAYRKKQQQCRKKEHSERMRSIARLRGVKNGPSYFFRTVERVQEVLHEAPQGDDLSSAMPPSSLRLDAGHLIPKSQREFFDALPNGMGADNVYLRHSEWAKRTMTDNDELAALEAVISAPTQTVAKGHSYDAAASGRRFLHQQRVRRRALAKAVEIRRKQKAAAEPSFMADAKGAKAIRLASSMARRRRKYKPFCTTKKRFRNVAHLREKNLGSLNDPRPRPPLKWTHNKDVKSAVFKSEGIRTSLVAPESLLRPGPGLYTPQLLAQQSDFSVAASSSAFRTAAKPPILAVPDSTLDLVDDVYGDAAKWGRDKRSTMSRAPRSKRAVPGLSTVDAPGDQSLGQTQFYVQHEEWLDAKGDTAGATNDVDAADSKGSGAMSPTGQGKGGDSARGGHHRPNFGFSINRFPVAEDDAREVGLSLEIADRQTEWVRDEEEQNSIFKSAVPREVQW